MKLLCFVILLIFITTSHQKTFSEVKQIWQGYLLKHSEKCLQETGVDYNLAMRLLPYGEFLDDHKLKCFFLCVSDNLFVVYEDGSIHPQNSMDVLSIGDADILQKANVHKCFDIKLPDKCESFYAVGECMYKALEKAMT